MSTTYPQLHQLFGAYFHQDWALDDSTSDAVVDRYLRENDRATTAEAANELTALLAASASDEELARTVQAIGCDYYPPGENVTYREWLERVRHRLTR